MSEPLTYTVTEAARALHVGRNTVYDLIRRGEMPALRIGRAVRVPRGALHEWLETNTTATPKGPATP